MKSNNTAKLKLSNHKIVVLVLALMMALVVGSDAQSTHSSQGLSGTWRVTVALQNCATGAPLGPPFQSILSFHEGGTLSGTTLNPAFAPGQRSSDYGVWDYRGNQTYSAASEAYIFFAGGPFARGTQRIAQTITVSGDTFTSNATVEFFDVNHNLVLGACAVATAARFQ
jgi:hypothetical protein